MGTQGTASHNFKQLGVIKIDISEASEDKIFELTVNSGANECFQMNIFMKFSVIKTKYIM